MNGVSQGNCLIICMDTSNKLDYVLHDFARIMGLKVDPFDPINVAHVYCVCMYE